MAGSCIIGMKKVKYTIRTRQLLCVVGKSVKKKLVNGGSCVD
jgi:hypothetical protein